MNIYSLPAIISFTINISIGLIVLLDRPRLTINRWFAAFIFSFALWNISEIAILNSRTASSALFAAQILYRIIFLTPAIFVIIAYSFPRSLTRWSRRLPFYIIVFAAPVILLALSFPNFQIELISFKQLPNEYYYHLKYNKNYLFFILVLFSLSYIAWGSVVLINKIPKLRTVRLKNQTRFLLIGVLTIAVLFLIINSFRTILEKEVSFYFLSTILSFIISLFFLAAIWQYKIIRISRVVRGGITYSIMSSLVLIIYFIIVRSFSETLDKYFQINSSLLDAIIIAILIILIKPFETRLQRLIERFLSKGIYQYRHNFFKLSLSLLTYMTPSIFFHKIEKFLKDNFQAEKVFIFLPNESGRLFKDVEKHGFIPKISLESDFIRRISQNKRAMEYYALHHAYSDEALHNAIEAQRIRLILPLIFENRLLSVIMLSRKADKRDYSEDEIEILSIFCNEIAIAFQRDKMIEDLRAEDQYRFRLQKLAAFGQLTAGIAHEIRNPLNTISASAETLIRKNLNSEDERDVQQFIIDEVNRLNRILSDFLNLSKLRKPKIVTIQLEKLFNRILLALETSEEEPITFQSEYKVKKNQLLCDEDLLYQLLLNLGFNCIEAIKDRCRQEKDFICNMGKINFSITDDNQQIIIKIDDNGIGIPSKNRESVFDPFFTTKENGTGLGLSIVQNIVESLNGEIKLKSKKGNTTFTISLPSAFDSKKETTNGN